MKKLFLVLCMIPSLAMSGELFLGIDHISRMNELDNGATMPQIGAAFNPTDNIDFEISAKYGDSKVMRNDLIEPDDEWYIGAEVKWKFFKF